MSFPFLHGLLIGLIVGIPIGPVGAVCFKYAISKGPRAAFSAGLGVTSGDTSFAMIIALGITALSDLLLSHTAAMCVFGGTFLIYTGISTLLTSQENRNIAETRDSYWKIFSSLYLLTISNPLTILTFAAFLSASKPTESLWEASLLIVGVSLGSLFWCFALTAAGMFLQKKLNFVLIHRLRRMTGFVILTFGISVLYKGLIN